MRSIKKLQWPSSSLTTVQAVHMNFSKAFFSYATRKMSFKEWKMGLILFLPFEEHLELLIVIFNWLLKKNLESWYFLSISIIFQIGGFQGYLLAVLNWMLFSLVHYCTYEWGYKEHKMQKWPAKTISIMLSKLKYVHYYAVVCINYKKFK